MKLIIRIIAIAALTYFVSPYSVWWIAMLITFVVCYISSASGLNAFVAGFLGVGLTWMGYAWNLDTQNQSAFSKKIAEVTQLGDPMLLIIATGLIGGLAGGFAAMSGATFKQIFKKKQQRSLYS